LSSTIAEMGKQLKQSVEESASHSPGVDHMTQGETILV